MGIRVAFVVDELGTNGNHAIPVLSAQIRKQGNDVRLFEVGPNPKRGYAAISAYAPQVVAYSLCSNESRRYLAINGELKKRFSFFSVFGGPHPTFSPEFVLESGVDAICRGEGDLVFPQLLDAFGTDAIYDVPNFAFQTGGGESKVNPLCNKVENLDSLPFPDRDLLFSQSRFLAQNPVKVFSAGRGCPFKCTFCFNARYNEMYRDKGPLLRTKSVDYLIDEILDVRARYPLTFVKFQDDIFGLDRKWLTEFASVYARRVGLPFSCYVRADTATPEYVALLKNAGCRAALMGVETANQHLREVILGKGLSDEQILEASHRIKEQGVRLQTFVIVGLPGETEDDMAHSVQLCRECGADYALATVFQPYPGTPILDYCKLHGYLESGFDQYVGHFSQPIIKMEPGLRQKAIVFQKLFALLVDHPRLVPLIKPLFRTARLNRVLDAVYRIYFGYGQHAHIYGSVIPLSVWLQGLRPLFSKNRI